MVGKPGENWIKLMRKLNISRFCDSISSSIFHFHFHFTSSVNFLFDDGQIVSIQIEICYFDHSMSMTVNIHTKETSCEQIKLGLFVLFHFDSSREASVRYTETDQNASKLTDTKYIKASNDVQMLLAVNHNIALSSSPFLVGCRKSTIDIHLPLSQVHHHWLQFNFFPQKCYYNNLCWFFSVSYLLNIHFEMWWMCDVRQPVYFSLCLWFWKRLILFDLIEFGWLYSGQNTQVYLFNRRL